MPPGRQSRPTFELSLQKHLKVLQQVCCPASATLLAVRPELPFTGVSMALHKKVSTKTSIVVKTTCQIVTLVAPYHAILRCYHCNTRHRTMHLQGGKHSPKMVQYPHLALSFTQAHLCSTSFCNILHDSCAIPHYCRDQKYSGSGKMFPGINF